MRDISDDEQQSYRHKSWLPFGLRQRRARTLSPLHMGRQTLHLFLLSAIFLAGCGPLKIARINADPSRYRNQTVRVSGTVSTSLGILGTGGYQIDDGTGKIVVLSRAEVPSRGSRVTVTGTVLPGVEVLGRAVGVAIREQSHRVK